VTVLPLILRQARAFRGVLAVLALLVFVTAFVAAAAPAALTRVYDSAIHDLLERAPAEVKDIQVAGRPSGDGGAGRLGGTEPARRTCGRGRGAERPARTPSRRRVGRDRDVESIVRIMERGTATGAVTYVSQSPSTVETSDSGPSYAATRRQRALH
jgi:hypothetical protein